ncbi:MAG: carbon monoxide dehydrogenase [Thermochromatium sp.]
MANTRQRHRHGVRKNLVEGVGGALTGAALVLFLRGLFQRRATPASADASVPSTTDLKTSGESA